MVEFLSVCGGIGSAVIWGGNREGDEREREQAAALIWDMGE